MYHNLKGVVTIFLLTLQVLAPALLVADSHGPANFVFFNRDREKIDDSVFINSEVIDGAQLKYSWRELEPQKGVYRLDLITSDLRKLVASDKKLFIQIQDVSFDESIVNVPEYLIEDSGYGKGASQQFDISNDDESKAVPEGLVANRWNGAVRGRFHMLLKKLGSEFDGKITGINLPETAVEFGHSGALYPEGFTCDIYRDAICETMRAAKLAFPNSIVIQYANFMPGEWLPWEDKGYLKSVYDCAHDAGVGVGGPDLKPYRKGQMNHSYPLIRKSKGIVPTVIAVQWGNYEYTNPKSHKRITVDEIYRFARDYLRVNYIFWSTQEPYFSRDVSNYLRQIKAR